MVRHVALIVFSAASLQFIAQAAEDQSWLIQGEYVALKNEDSGIVVLRTSGGLIEVPLAAFSSSGRAAIGKLSGRSDVSKVASGELPKTIADDLAACASAAEATDACTLLLADPSLTEMVRGLLRQQLKNFESRAARGEVRFGKDWAPPDVVREAAGKAGAHLASAAEMMRLGNPKLVEEELRKASQSDPSSGQADFLIGLAFMMKSRPDYEKALESFEEVIRRQPISGPAWNNLGVCKAQQRKYPEALEAFRNAARDVASRGATVANLAVLITYAADRRSRIATRELEDIKALYQDLAKGQGGAPPTGGPVVLSPGGAPVAAGAMSDLSSLLTPPPAAGSSENAELLGLVVGVDAVLCSLPKDVTSVSDGLVVITNDGRNLPAQRVAATSDGSLLLFKCDGLGVSAMPLAASTPKPGEPAIVCQPMLGPVQPAITGKFLTKPAASHERPRCVVDVGAAADGGGGGPAVVVLDISGRLAGVGVSQPPSRSNSSSRRLFVPVDGVWRLLDQLDESSRPKENQGGEQLALAEAASRCQAAVVRVRTAQPIVTKP